MEKEKEVEKKPIPQDTAPEGTVNVSKTSLDKLTSRLEELEGKVDYVADKSRLQKHEDKNKVEEPTQVRLSKYKGLVVVGWGNMVTNQVDDKGNTISQIRKLYLEDGSEMNVPYEESIRLTRINASIMGENITNELDPDGNKTVIFDLETEDGTKVKVNRRFVN